MKTGVREAPGNETVQISPGSARPYCPRGRGARLFPVSLMTLFPPSIHKLRENVFQEHQSLKEKELETGPKASHGYGGKFGVEQDRMDKVSAACCGQAPGTAWACRAGTRAFSSDETLRVGVGEHVPESSPADGPCSYAPPPLRSLLRLSGLLVSRWYVGRPKGEQGSRRPAPTSRESRASRPQALVSPLPAVEPAAHPYQLQSQPGLRAPRVTPLGPVQPAGVLVHQGPSVGGLALTGGPALVELGRPRPRGKVWSELVAV